MSAWITTLAELRDRGENPVLVSVAATRGSTPREAGTAMLVTRARVHGTIGGGHLEFKAIDIARDMLDAPEEREMRRFPLGASLGQCCGGVVELLFDRVGAKVQWTKTLAAALDAATPVVLVRSTRGSGDALVVSGDSVSGALGQHAPNEQAIAIARELLSEENPKPKLAAFPEGRSFLFEPVMPQRFRIVLFGAGHVGRALVNALSGLDCRITWIDSRESEFPETVPRNVAIDATDAPEALVDAAQPGTVFLVMTHSHALDYELAEAILRRGDFRWFGLIGSTTKRKRFEHQLAARGMDARTLSRMTCPIGIGGIESKQPAAIAIAVAAQVLQVNEVEANIEARTSITRSGRKPITWSA